MFVDGQLKYSVIFMDAGNYNWVTDRDLLKYEGPEKFEELKTGKVFLLRINSSL